MSQIFFRILGLLTLFQCAHQEDKIYKENNEVEIRCTPPKSGIITFWFRVQDNGMGFIGSHSNGFKAQDENFEYRKGSLILKKFMKKRDSGIYSCASLNSNNLYFGTLTYIRGLPDPTTTATTTTTTTESSTTIQQCKCLIPKADKSVTGVNCEMVIWAPLAGGSCLLFLILVVTACYCKRTRTRGCPHHYKRKPKYKTPTQQPNMDRYV